MSEDKKPRFNDRIIREGFPEGWYIQDRICQDQALLIRRVDNFVSPFGNLCICTRPRAMSTDDWLKTAQIIAHGFERENTERLRAEIEKEYPAVFDTVMKAGACVCCGERPIAYQEEQECAECFVANSNEGF